jgi:hypothetical protein
MARIVLLIILAAVVVPAAIFSSQESGSIIEDALIANEYVRVARLVLPPGGKISVPDNGHVHLLITVHAGALTDVTDSLHPQRLELPEGSGVRMFAAGRADAFSNNERTAFSALWLELQKDPGHITCSETKACPWSFVRWTRCPWCCPST